MWRRRSVDKSAAPGPTSSLRGIFSLRVALGLFMAGTAGLVFLSYLEYQRVIDYCADSPEVEAGGDKFSCLEPYHWLAEAGFALGGLIVVIGLATFVLAVFLRTRQGQVR
jgi:hypothetical protein